MMGNGLAGGWSARRPFMAFVIGSLYTWTGPMPDAVVATNVLLGAWTVALVCRIGQRVFGPAVGLVAGLAFAFDPISIEYCSYLLTETLGTFLFVCSVHQIVAGLQQNRVSSCWWAGVLFALSNLTRTLTLPAVGSSRRLIQRRKVDLPEPLPPMMAITSPCFAVSETPFSTSNGPKRLCRSVTAIAWAASVIGTPLQRLCELFLSA